MKVISFAWTTAALLAGAKTCTRRNWSPNYARKFHKGDLVAAYDRSPRFGGKQVVTIRLTCDPYLENTAKMTSADYDAEGLHWMAENNILMPVSAARGRYVSAQDFFRQWRFAAEDVWVVRFEVLP